MPLTITNGAHYLLIITDCVTKVTFVRLIKHKNDAFAEIIKFYKLIYTQLAVGRKHGI
jgi:hypothetical protein